MSGSMLTHAAVQSVHAVQVEPVAVQDAVDGLTLDVVCNLTQSLWGGEEERGRVGGCPAGMCAVRNIAHICQHGRHAG